MLLYRGIGWRKIKNILLFVLATTSCTASNMVVIGKKLFFLPLGYLIRVEHEDFSEMCV
jgi:hypothetical protein